MPSARPSQPIRRCSTHTDCGSEIQAPRMARKSIGVEGTASLLSPTAMVDFYRGAPRRSRPRGRKEPSRHSVCIRVRLVGLACDIAQYRYPPHRHRHQCLLCINGTLCYDAEVIFVSGGNATNNEDEHHATLGNLAMFAEARANASLRRRLSRLARIGRGSLSLHPSAENSTRQDI
jgi:hypothetical protein